MPGLKLDLLGPGVLRAETGIVRVHSARALALLAWLVLESGRRHPRARLIELLWPGQPAALGSQSLRQALYSLRTVANRQLSACLRVDPRWVQFDAPVAGSEVDIDVYRLLDAVGSDRPADWEAAAAIPAAPLLDGLMLETGTEFDGWLGAERQRLRALALHNLRRLSLHHLGRAEWQAALRHAEAMVEQEPTSEIASELVLRVQAARGDRAALEVESVRLREHLHRDLGVQPSLGWLRLYGSLVPLSGPVADEVTAAKSAAASPARTAASASAGAAEAEAMVWAAQAAERVFGFSQAADLYGRALRVMALQPDTDAARRIEVLLRLDSVLERLGRRTDQRDILVEALTLADHQGDAARTATVCLRRASLFAYQRQHRQALQEAERALALFRTLGDAPGEAEALRELGFVHWHAEHHALALAHTREAIALHRRIGDTTGEATAVHNLAEIQRALGSPRLACQGFEQALRLHWATRNTAGEILSLFGWAQALRQAGDLATSTARLDTARQLSEASGERVMQSRVLHALAMASALQGDDDAALGHLRRAIDIDRAIGYAHALGHDLTDLANLHLLRGEVASARVALLEAAVWFSFNDDTQAQQSLRERLLELDLHGDRAARPIEARTGVKSHLALGEGKVYCEFESPIGRQRSSDD